MTGHDNTAITNEAISPRGHSIEGMADTNQRKEQGGNVNPARSKSDTIRSDLTQAEHFLKLLDEGRAFRFRAVYGGNRSSDKPGCLEELAHHNERGAAAYVVVNDGGDVDADISRIRAVFADLDGAPLEPVERCGLEPHVIVETSPGKYHAYWIVRDLPVTEFRGVQRRIAERFNSDTQVKNPSRVMRLPGFIHQKAEPFRSRIIRENGGQPYDAMTILAEFPPLDDSSASRAERLHDIDTADSIVQALRENALIRNRRKDGAYNILCPFAHEHTTESNLSETVYFPAHTGGFATPRVVCLHEHCANRSMDEYREALGVFEGDELGGGGSKGESFSGLDQFALNGMAGTMEAQMLDDRYILGNLAILGQSTVFYAKPNAGKTLLALYLLIEAIQADEINGADVFYINADDNHKGLTEKLKLAEQHGFRMMAPGYPRQNPFKPPMLAGLLQYLIKNEQAHGKVLILDTVKKFTDLMKKDKASEFGDAVRQFVSHGGSVIMLAHVNKHRDQDGGLVYSGTSDLVDDADCAHILDIMTDDECEGTRRVKFTNFKNRGDVALEAVYSYDAGAKVSYLARLESVKAVSDEEREKAEKERQKQDIFNRNREAVEAITASLREGVKKRTELIKDAQGRSGVGRQKVIRALDEHTGRSALNYEYWHFTVAENNAHVYELN